MWGARMKKDMRKEITKDSNSHKIRITAEDRKTYNLQDGDYIELTITKIDRTTRKNAKR